MCVYNSVCVCRFHIYIERDIFVCLQTVNHTSMRKKQYTVYKVTKLTHVHVYCNNGLGVIKILNTFVLNNKRSNFFCAIMALVYANTVYISALCSRCIYVCVYVYGSFIVWSGPRVYRSRCCPRSPWPSSAARKQPAWPPSSVCEPPGAASLCSPASGPWPEEGGLSGVSLALGEAAFSPGQGRQTVS